ncbi:MAG: hypothetical protein ACK4OF_01465 [Aquificaceae bacterium]
MEIRRIEGTLLQHAIEQSQPLMAEKSASNLRIRILSTVPEVLLDLFSGGGTLRARVSYSEGSIVSLNFSEDLEIKAENKSSIPFMIGDMVDLTLESTNPFVLKIIGLYRRSQFSNLLKSILEGKSEFFIQMDTKDFKNSVENSGLFYERKLLDLMLGRLKAEDLLEDLKAQLMESALKDMENLSELFKIDFKKAKDIKAFIDSFIEEAETYKQMANNKEVLVLVERLQNTLYKLELLSQLQWLMLGRGNILFLPFQYKEGKGGLMFRAGDDFTVFLRLNYESGFVAGLLKRPRANSILDVKIFTDITSLAERFRDREELLKDMLLEEGIELRRFIVEVVEEGKLIEEIKTNLSEEGFSLLV